MAGAADGLRPLPATRELPAVSCDVKYHGFVYVNGGAGIIPGLDKVQEAVSLLKKPKKARKAHPLFARGFDQMLTMRVSEQGLKVLVNNEDAGTKMVVMDHAIHKIAFVCNQGKSVLFIAKRRIDSSVDQFKCHGFETTSIKTAKQLASHLVSTCNSVFRKLRRTRKQIRKKTEKDGRKLSTGTGPKAGATLDEAARLKAELQAEVDAAKSYRESLQVALSELDEDEDDEDEVDSDMAKDMDKAYRINYEEFADEFAKISLEISAAAEQQKERRVLRLTDDAETMETVDELTESTADIDLDGGEFEISRSASI
eukprot:m.54951 g.54951  ORF g.54951 m.54951 type:complete len:313 (+) comp7569_c0_seq2:115-1053(+)